MNEPILTPAALERIYLVPVEMPPSAATCILDEEARVVRDERGLPVYGE